MQPSSGKLIEGAALIYERANGVVYARYRDPPNNLIPRWVIGGDPVAVAHAQGDLLSYVEWKELCELSLEYPTLKKLLDKVVVTYYTIRDNPKE
jgi:hypothetical protein